MIIVDSGVWHHQARERGKGEGPGGEGGSGRFSHLYELK